MSIAGSTDLDAVLQPIAQRLQAVYRRFPTTEQLLAEIDDVEVGCIVFEDSGDGTRSEGFCEAVQRHPVAPPTVAVVHHPKLEIAVRVMRRGAMTLHPSTISVETLEESIGEALAASEQVRQVLGRLREVAGQLDRLTEGELRVLRLVLEGNLNKRIANQLQISERTVEARRKRIFEKMGTQSVAQLVRAIIETVGMDDILRRCGEPVAELPVPKWLPTPHWHLAERSARAARHE